MYVDEYQDTDPMQVRLLRALVDAGTALVAVGDPDQAIYGFRGADVGGLLSFREVFRDAAGQRAPAVVLRRTRRFGPVLRAAAGSVLGDRVPKGLTIDEVRAIAPPVRAGTPGDGRVEVLLVDDEGAEAAHVADLVRRAVLSSRLAAAGAAAAGGDAAEVTAPLAWSDIAVVVRSGVRSIPLLRRALGAAGVPVEVAGDELPLREEPAVAVLLDALRWAAGTAAATPDLAERLLLSPLGSARSRRPAPPGARAAPSGPRGGSRHRAAARRRSCSPTPSPTSGCSSTWIAGGHPPGSPWSAGWRGCCPVRAPPCPPGPPRPRCSGCCGPVPAGRPDWSGRPCAAARRVAGPTGTSTPSSRCSTRSTAPDPVGVSRG